MEIRLLAKPAGSLNARLLVEPVASAALPRVISYPFGDGTVVLNDDGTGGDQKAHDGIYSADVHYDISVWERRLAAKLPFLQRIPATSKTPRTTRLAFTGFDRNPQVNGPNTVAAVRAALVQLDRLASPRFAHAETSLFRVEDRGYHQLNALLMGRPVLVDALLVDRDEQPTDVNYARSLVITNLDVVNDPVRTYDLCNSSGNPNGPWTFKHLMTELASSVGTAPGDFITDWLQQAGSLQTLNGFQTTARPRWITTVLNGWQRNPDGSLDLDRAPFRLLAIVSRTDLAQPSGYSTAGNVGETRFVFGVLDPQTPCSTLKATVIFEYGVRKATCPARHQWVQSWMDLTTLTTDTGSSQHRALLETITRNVTDAAAQGEPPNINVLDQLRTDDFLSFPWALREFHMGTGADYGRLVLSTVKQTPDLAYNDLSNTAERAALTAYISQHTSAILANNYVVPPSFLGAEGTNPSGFTWTSPPFPGLNTNAVQIFAQGACQGCHEGSQNAGFLQIFPRAHGDEAALSPFMLDTDDSSSFPIDPPAFDPSVFPGWIQDDIERRETAMAQMLNAPCLFDPFVSQQFVVSASD